MPVSYRQNIAYAKSAPKAAPQRYVPLVPRRPWAEEDMAELCMLVDRGHSWAEVAAIIGRSEDSAKQQYYRTRKDRVAA